MLRTRKIRNVVAGRTRLALVIDALVSIEPFLARGVGSGYYLRVAPTVSWSWNMEGEPAGDEWYPTGRAVHGGD